MGIEQNVQNFRMTLLMQMPFYGDVINGIPFRANGRIKTAATDGLTVEYSPDFFRTLTQGQQNYVLMHEVMHILLRHSIRRGEKRPDLWNAACDLVVNQMLDNFLTPQMKQIGLAFERPSEGLFSDGYDRRSAEDYYEQLKKDNPFRKKTVRFVLRRASAGVAERACEAPVPTDLPQESTVEEISGELNGILRQALASSEVRNQGYHRSIFIPEQVQGFVIRKPLNWKRLLKDLMQETEDDSDSSWTTPERKYIHMDLLLPGHCRSESDELGEVWAFIDSSGSISSEEMSRFRNELWHILREFRCLMHLAYWDTQVTDVYQRIDSEKKLLQCLPHHSGGTDINCVYRYITEKKLEPEVLIILTDGAFGVLQDTTPLRKLRGKTVMVLSVPSGDDSFKMYGRIASL